MEPGSGQVTDLMVMAGLTALVATDLSTNEAEAFSSAMALARDAARAAGLMSYFISTVSGMTLILIMPSEYSGT